MPRPIVASKIERIWLPDSVKRWRTPAAVSASTSRTAPLVLMRGPPGRSARGDGRQQLRQLCERGRIERGRRRAHARGGDPAAAAEDLLADSHRGAGYCAGLGL